MLPLTKQLSESVVMLQILVASQGSFLASHTAIPSTLHDLDFLTTNIPEKKNILVSFTKPNALQ